LSKRPDQHGACAAFYSMGTGVFFRGKCAGAWS